MSMKKWQTLAEKKAAVEQQNDKILAAMKNKAIEKEFGQLSGEEVFKPLTRRLDRSFATQKKTDAEEGPNYNLDDFDLNNPFGEDFRPDVETPPPTPPPSPEVPDYSMVESDQDFEEETPTSSPPLTSSPVPPLAEKEDDDDDDDDDAEGDDVAEGGDDGATLSHDLSQSVERAKWGTPQKPGIEGSESTDLQVLNSMLTKNVNNPNYVVKSPKSKFYGYTLSDIKKARDEILERRGEKKAKSSLFFEKEPPDQEGSGVVDVNDLVDRLYISIGSIKAVIYTLLWERCSEAESFWKKTEFVRFGLSTPISLPGNAQHQTKTGYKFSVTDRSNWYDWYNAYLRADFTFEATADGAAVAGDTRSAPINGSFSLINKLMVKSGGKILYNVDNIHKLIFIKNLLDYSDDFSRSVAKSQFWYLDTDNSLVTAAADATNSGIQARGLLAHAGATVNTIIPLNRYSFFEELSDKLLPPMQLEIELQLQSDAEMIWQNDGTNRRIVVRTLELWVPKLRFTSEGQTLANEDFLKPRKWTYMREMVAPSTSQRAAFGTWQINPGIKDAKHVFIFIQQTRKVNALTQNPYFFDTFDIDGDDSAKLATCRLEYGASNFYPESEYDENFKLRILNDVMNYRYRKNDYNTGVQLQTSNFSTLYPFLYFDLRENKDNLTNDPKQMVFHYRLNEAANAQDYTIFAAILYESEMVLKEVGNELVVV
ncbi:hypothetical protein ACROYT_G035963 [Oculina patagonica]